MIIRVSFFVFSCVAVEAKTVILYLKKLFSVYDMPSYIHSDRGLVFTFQELITFLHRCGVIRSKTLVYNARGNGQCK